MFELLTDLNTSVGPFPVEAHPQGKKGDILSYCLKIDLYL